MNKKVNTPHDLFLKATLHSPQAIRDCFQAHLPQDLCKYIDRNSIQPAKASHVSSILKALHNDLIFTCQIDQNLGFILLEHQSTPDWSMPLRFAEYNINLINHYLKGKKPRTPLPFILNMCLFHGKINQLYPYPTHLYDYFPNPSLAQELDIFAKFHLSNLSTTSDPQLESHGTMRLIEKLFKYSREKELFEVLGEELGSCRNWILGEKMRFPPLGADYWKSILYYASNVLNPLYHSEENLVSLFKEKLLISKEKIMTTIAQQIEKRGEIKGIGIGMQQGMQQGMHKTKLSIARDMLQSGEAIQKIIKYTGLSLDTIKKLTQA